jgi:hypothetical protein
MTTIVVPDLGTVPRAYKAVSGERTAVGPTIGDAFKNLADQIGDPDETTFVVIQPMRPDRFFGAEQVRRLTELMAKWRAARDSGSSLPEAEQAELDSLVEAELEGTIRRSQAILDASRT